MNAISSIPLLNETKLLTAHNRFVVKLSRIQQQAKTNIFTGLYFATKCEITLYIKENTETENYDRFLDEYGLQTLVKKYSDYIRYPIKMMMTHTHPIPKPEDAGDDWKPLRLLRRPGNPVDTGAWPPPMISMLERIRDGLLAVPENGEKADAQAAVTEWVDAEGFLGHA